ncbi:K(+)-transporting ATPase subunit C [Pleurocapsa sp. CCALA 161]|uniref:K(+)-transporting ATPase subunit C n=1 Tax=Pleurocapsa sp. CCALA 161 TaxID=2107688 RepID=UPI0018EB84BB|nr:K(+)-transporting ATPase subunit C [Pleurocapsa sp. CCALA 161]
MSILRETITGIRTTFILWLLTALIYPSLLIALGQFIFPNQANGSLITNAQGDIIGSALIGQNFTSDRYFFSRPSTTNYSTGDDAKLTGVSGASNLAPSNPELKTRVQETVTQLKQQGIEPTADLVYTSGSSLDPHITAEAARTQIQRVAQARGLDTNQVELLMTKNTEGRFLSIFGEPGVNVLKLNLALDNLNKR